MERDLMRGFGEVKKISPPTVENLAEQEKGFNECFAEATLPVLLWLSSFNLGEAPPAFGALKERLQSQALPTIPELRRAEPSSWETLYHEKVQEFRSKADKPTTKEQKDTLERAIENRRVMSGMRAPQNRQQELLPRYFFTEEKGRDFCYRVERGEKILSVPDPRPFTFRINIPDAPGELREVILDRVAQKLWQEPLFKRHGFQAKIIGFAKTDGLIFYFSDKVVNKGLKIIHEDALQHKYGSGEPARFGQLIEPRISGMTLTTNPKNQQGDTAGTFGDVVSDLLATSLTEALRKSKMSPDKIMSLLLDLEADDWASEVLEPIFAREAEKRFGNRLNMHNLAFIDKG